MGRPGRSITLSLSEQDKAHLETLAVEFDMTWGDRPNISELVKAIASRKLVIAPNHDWTIERVHILNRARTALVDIGEIEIAMAIAQLLLERSELTIPLRAEIEQFTNQPTLSWRLEIERYIHRHQPFCLSYQDAAERVWQFTIRYAEIAKYEERQYLDCWCEEIDGSQDLPELAHNRCLRLDRITDAAVSPIEGKWSELATIAVELHLFRGLAFAYRSKTARDEVNEWVAELPQVRRVVRRVSSTFWLIREVLRYGQDCEVIAPDAVRDRVKQEVRSLAVQYGLL
jgi:WYL domain